MNAEAKLRVRVRQFVCGLHGHDALLHFEGARVSLKCTSCQYETPGWDLKGTAPTPPREASKRIALPLVGHRRVC